MKKIYSKSELEAMASNHFKTNTANVLFATADGNFFINKNRAEIHAGSKGQIYEFIKKNEPIKQLKTKTETQIKE